MSEEKIKDANTDGGSSQQDDSEEEIPFEERFKKTVEKMQPYIIRLREARKKLIFINLSITILAGIILLLLVNNYYTSTVTILPDYGNKETSLSQLSGLASLAGVNLGQNTPTEIYQNLLTSEVILRPVIYAKYLTENFRDSVNLIQYFKIKSDASLSIALRKRKMFLKEYNSLIINNLSTAIDRMSQILTITVTMPEAQLSADVVNNITKSLENYVQTQRKSYASDQEKYIEKRILQVKDSLNIAENVLTRFNEQNRAIAQSPLLQLQQERLTRNVDISNTVYLELRKQLELARIDEINDTPIVNVQEYANNPVIKSGPHRLTLLIIILFFSLFITVTYYLYGNLLKKYWQYLEKGLKSNQIKE